MQKNYARKLLQNMDWTLLLVVLVIMTISILHLRSLSLATQTNAYVTQIVWLLLGILVAIFVSAFDYRTYDRFAYYFYGFVLFLLVLVLLVGKEVNGSQRWLSFGGLTMQPSELTKVSLILVFSKFFHHTRRIEGYGLRDLIKPFFLLALPVVLTLKEPDLGTSLVMVFIFCTLLVFEKVRKQVFYLFIIVSLVSVPLAWKFGLKDYQKTRVTAFLNPDIDRLGAGWQSYQSLVAVGAGQMTGKGYMQSTQTVGGFLPYTETDFVIAAFAEEHGFIGIIVLKFLYLFLIFWALRIATLAKDKFGAAIAVGVASMIFCQVVINVGMVLNVLPVVGVTLPLMSYGGSSVLSIMLGLGLLFNISMRQHMHVPM